MFGRRNGGQTVTSNTRAKRAWQLELADHSGSDGDLPKEEQKSKQSDAHVGRSGKDKNPDGGRKRIRRQAQRSQSKSFDEKNDKGEARDSEEDDRSPVRRRNTNHDSRRAEQDKEKTRRGNHHASPQQRVSNRDFEGESAHDDGKTQSRRHRRSSPHNERDARRHVRSSSRPSLRDCNGNQVIRRDSHYQGDRGYRKSCRRSPSQRSPKERANETTILRARGKSARSPSRYDPHKAKMRMQGKRRRSQSRKSRNRSRSEVGASEDPVEKRSKEQGDEINEDERYGTRRSARQNREAGSPDANNKSKVGKENGAVSPGACDDDNASKKNDDASRTSPKVCEEEDKEQTVPSPEVDGKEDQTKKKADKEYAWMESGDEADCSSEGAPASPPPSFPIAKEVETLGQMLRLAEHLLGQKMEELQGLEPLELVEICAAAARVKYYDPALFSDALAPALLYRFRRGLDASLMADSNHLTVENALDIISSLAALNAASASPIADVFRAAARALEEHGASLTIPQRRLLKDVYKAGGREKDVAFIDRLASPSDPSAIAAAAFKGSQRAGTNGDGLAMRPGARICESYAKTGTCRTGPTCRNDHPESLRVIYNSDGYPLRPWAPNCPYYMNQGTCDFRKTCKWHHPDKKDRGGPGNVSYISKGSWVSR